MSKYIFKSYNSTFNNNYDIYDDINSDIYYDNENNIILVNNNYINNIKNEMEYIKQLLEDIDNKDKYVIINLSVCKYNSLKKIFEFINIYNNEIKEYLNVEEHENLSDVYDRNIPETLNLYLNEFNLTNNNDDNYKIYLNIIEFLNNSDYLQYEKLLDVFNFKIADFIYKIDKNVLITFLKKNNENTPEMIDEFINDLTYI